MPCGRSIKRTTTKYAPVIIVPHSAFLGRGKPDSLKPTKKYPIVCPCDKATSYDGKMTCEGEYQ